jgi:hypothetical protein
MDGKVTYPLKTEILLISVLCQFQGSEGRIFASSQNAKTTVNLTSKRSPFPGTSLTSSRKLASCAKPHLQGHRHIRHWYNLVARSLVACQYPASISRLLSFRIGSSSRFPLVKTSSWRFSCAISFMSSSNSLWSKPSFTFFHSFADFLFSSSRNSTPLVRFLLGFSIHVG